MKNLLRAFALTVVATGAVASMHASNANVVSAKAMSSTLAAPPIPMCPPNDPNACGMGSR